LLLITFRILSSIQNPNCYFNYTKIVSNKERVCIELFHRDQYSLGEENRQKYGWATYHWAILVRPKVVRRESKCTSYDVTDAAVMTEDGTGYRPADGTWRFRSRVPVYPLTSSSFLVAIDIGKLPKNVTSAQVRAVLERTTVPRSGQDPEQNRVSWTRDAILDLQRAGFVDSALSVEDVMTVGMQKADIVMRDGALEKPEDRFIDVGVVSREIAAMKAGQKKRK
jgi:hypothetical protein